MKDENKCNRREFISLASQISLIFGSSALMYFLCGRNSEKEKSGTHEKPKMKNRYSLSELYENPELINRIDSVSALGLIPPFVLGDGGRTYSTPECTISLLPSPDNDGLYIKLEPGSEKSKNNILGLASSFGEFDIISYDENGIGVYLPDSNPVYQKISTLLDIKDEYREIKAPDNIEIVPFDSFKIPENAKAGNISEADPNFKDVFLDDLKKGGYMDSRGEPTRELFSNGTPDAGNTLKVISETINQRMSYDHELMNLAENNFASVKSMDDLMKTIDWWLEISENFASFYKNGKGVCQHYAQTEEHAWRILQEHIKPFNRVSVPTVQIQTISTKNHYVVCPQYNVSGQKGGQKKVATYFDPQTGDGIINGYHFFPEKKAIRKVA